MQYPTDIFSEYEAQLASETMGNPVKKDGGIDWKWVIPTAFGAAILIGGFLWAAHSEISKIDDRLVALDKHISRVETAVRIVGAKQGGDTKTLIDEALTVAKKDSDAGRMEAAKSVLEIANRLLVEQKSARIEAPPEFFDAALNNYKSLRRLPQLADYARTGTIQLAEYKSAISGIPPDFADGKIGEIRQIGPLLYLKDGMFGPHTLQIGVGADGTLDIDNFIAENVVFHDLTIIYRGGPLVLRDVHFVNCRFMVPDSPNADQFLTAAIKQPATAQIS